MSSGASLTDWMLLVGRILLVVMFLLSGVSKAVRFKDGLAEVNAKHLPLPRLALIGTILVQVVAGVLIVVGHYTGPAAAALAFFTLATALVFYDFWSVQGSDRALLQTGFLEHISIIGGMLLLIGAGPGSLVL